jgi:hypothetical protein
VHSTRVTEPIIRGIELDDYAACGGDFYARGHIRAIARAVGRIPGNAATPWYSQWYATPAFSALKTGTGLLLDMGHPVTVSSVRLWLVNRSGADLQLRAGAKPVPTWLPQVASASNAGGTVQFQLSAPVHVRYLLIWFTKLPPDSAGTYQASVYKITVQGQP